MWPTEHRWLVHVFCRHFNDGCVRERTQMEETGVCVCVTHFHFDGVDTPALIIQFLIENTEKSVKKF